MRIFIIAFLMCLVCVAPVYSQNKKTEYQSVEITKFEIKPDVKFPASRLDVMMSEIAEELTKTKKFSSVKNNSPESESAEKTPEATTDTDKPKVKPGQIADNSALYLTGIVTEYKEGNRAARYLIGFGAGRAKVKARIKISDSAGNILLERDVDGNLIIGAFGGNSSVVTRGLAKEIRKVLLKKFF